MDATALIQIAINGTMRGAMYGLMGMGMALIFGIVGIVNLCHGELFMIGCYVMYWVMVALGLPPWLGILAATAGLFLVGIAIERGMLAPLRWRLGGKWLTDGYVLTIGLMIVFQNIALILFGANDRAVASIWRGRFFLGDIVIAKDRVAILAGAAIAVTALALFLRFTHFGRAIRATGEHPEAAQVIGINIRRIYTVTFGIGSALAGACGALLLSAYPAYPTVGGEIMLKSFVVVIVGGLGNVGGAMVAGLLLGLLEAFATVLASGGWQNALSAFLVLLVLVARPSGLFSKRTSRP